MVNIQILYTSIILHRFMIYLHMNIENCGRIIFGFLLYIFIFTSLLNNFQTAM